MEMILLDTNILIEILKGNQTTIAQLEKLNSLFSISVISYMELIYGALNKNEVKKIEKFLYQFEIFPINEQISLKALELIKQYAKSHFLDIPDALIAATAIENDCQLFTYNLKDFQYIKNLNLI